MVMSSVAYPNSASVPFRWAWERQAPPDQKMVLLELAARADPLSGYVYPRLHLSELAERLMTTERSIRRQVASLVRLGYVQRHKLHVGRAGGLELSLCLDEYPSSETGEEQDNPADSVLIAGQELAWDNENPTDLVPIVNAELDAQDNPTDLVRIAESPLAELSGDNETPDVPIVANATDLVLNPTQVAPHNADENGLIRPPSLDPPPGDDESSSDPSKTMIVFVPQDNSLKYPPHPPYPPPLAEPGSVFGKNYSHVRVQPQVRAETRSEAWAEPTAPPRTAHWTHPRNGHARPPTNPNVRPPDSIRVLGVRAALLDLNWGSAIMSAADKRAIDESEAPPELIAKAFVSASRSDWGNDWLVGNLSMRFVIDRLAAYQAWESRGCPAPPRPRHFEPPVPKPQHDITGASTYDNDKGIKLGEAHQLVTAHDVKTNSWIDAEYARLKERKAAEGIRIP